MKTNKDVIKEMQLQVKIMEKSYNVLTERIKRLDKCDPERDQCIVERQTLWDKCDMLDRLIKEFSPKEKMPLKFKAKQILNIIMM